MELEQEARQQIISRISKGSKMDQIYLPKSRIGFSIGNYVIIQAIMQEDKEKAIKVRATEKPIFYNTLRLPSIKLQIINEIFKITNQNLRAENIILTGSFLEPGFKFNDIDILIVREKDEEESKIEVKKLKEVIEKELDTPIHIIEISNKALLEGLSSDPLYENMLSKCVSKKKIVFNIKRRIIPELLDLHLLKSKDLINNFDILNGEEKYYLTKNLVSILLFLKNKKISNDNINNHIKEEFNINSEELKQNMLNKKNFIKKYREFYDKTFRLILKLKSKEI